MKLKIAERNNFVKIIIFSLIVIKKLACFEFKAKLVVLRAAKGAC